MLLGPVAWSSKDLRLLDLGRSNDYTPGMTGWVDLVRVIAATLLAGVVLSSCHSADPGVARRVIPTALGEERDLIEVEAYYFSVPEGFGFKEGQKSPGIAGTYPGDVGARLVKSLARRRGFDQSKISPLTGREVPGKPMELLLMREFIFPTEYQSAVVGKAGPDGISPVTPATPIEFEKRDLGTFLKVLPRPLADGKLKVTIDLKRVLFLGFVNYGEPITAKTKGAFGREVEVVVSENRIEMPVFDVKRTQAELRVDDGDFIALSGFRPEERGEMPNFTPSNPAQPEFSGRDFVALVRIRTVRQGGRR